jgi:putative addiction module killer protein
MEGREREVLYYKTKLAVFPFREWRSRITDDATRATIDARIGRLRGGNFGNSEPIGGGASENKIDFGPGYRIYYGVAGNNVVLLCGGNKSTQSLDIERAKKYWADYKEREQERRTIETEKKVLKDANELQQRSPRRPKK